MQTLRVLLSAVLFSMAASVLMSFSVHAQALPACPPLKLALQPVPAAGAFVQSQPDRLHGTSFIELANAAPVGLQYQLKPGLLRPQVEALLREYLQIQVVIWHVHDSHFWPTDFRLTAASLDGLLEALLQPYGMGIRLYTNHTAEIFYHGSNGRESGR